jgi:hypothetical protein
MERVAIHQVDLIKAIQKFNECEKDDEIRFLRFGQYLYNVFIPAKEFGPWPELFYERDNKKAYDLFMTRVDIIYSEDEA